MFCLEQKTAHSSPFNAPSKMMSTLQLLGMEYLQSGKRNPKLGRCQLLLLCFATKLITTPAMNTKHSDILHNAAQCSTQYTAVAVSCESMHAVKSSHAVTLVVQVPLCLRARPSFSVRNILPPRRLSGSHIWLLGTMSWDRISAALAAFHGERM